MKLSRLIVGLTVVLAASAAASADVIGTWDSGVAVTDTAFAVPFSGTRYTLTLTSTVIGELITAVDMKIEAVNPTADHAFYNEQGRDGKIFAGGLATGWDVDTVWLVTGDLAISGSGENDTTPADPNWDYTSDLYAAFAFKGGYAFGFQSAPVAQIILPDGEAAPTLAMLWNTNDALNNAYAVTRDGPTAPDGVKQTIIPEPATLALLALGGVVVLRRRSR